MACVLVAAALTGACSAHSAGEGATRPSRPAPSLPRIGNAQVLTAQQLQTRAGTLLDALTGRISMMRIERRNGRCPLITMRGQKTIEGNPDPRIYVDGTPMIDTCALNQVRALDVERVEVYPSGFTDRPGYRGHPNGLILVFLTGSPPEE